MKAPLIPILLILASTAGAQKITTYYDFQWKPTEGSHARFISILEHTDSGWHRQDYFVHGPTIQMDGWYEDSACKIENGKFIYGPSSAGHWTADHKRQGLWKFFHNTGKLSAQELYDHGRLLEKQYYQEDGQPQMDTTNKDHKCTFGKDASAWLKWLGNNLRFPPDYRITGSDLAAVVVTFTVDVDGTVKDAYISTPFFPPFNREALRTINKCPKWHPAVEHNRRVQATMRQPVVFSQPDDQAFNRMNP